MDNVLSFDCLFRLFYKIFSLEHKMSDLEAPEKANPDGEAAVFFDIMG